MTGIKYLADLYRDGEDVFDALDPLVIEEITNYVNKNFGDIKYICKFVDESLDDYEDVVGRLINEGFLYISTLHNNSRLLPGFLNLKFRAVHDFVHVQNRLPFDFNGEYACWLIQQKGLSLAAKDVLHSEIVLQAAYATQYGIFPETQKIVLTL